MPSYPRAPLEQIGPPRRSPMTGLFCDETTFDNHVSDVEHIQKTVARLRQPFDEDVEEGFGPCGMRATAVPGEGSMCVYPDCDCFNSETIMLSTGYAEAYRDGEVISHGVVIFKEEP